MVTNRRGILKSLQHRGGCHGIGGRDDGPERERRGPGQFRNEELEHPPDRESRERDRADREKQDRPQIGAEIPPYGEERVALEQRRQEQRHREIGVERQRWQAGDHGEHHAANDIGRGRRDTEAAGDEREQHRDREQP